jgi:hypothetical protein
MLTSQKVIPTLSAFAPFPQPAPQETDALPLPARCSDEPIFSAPADEDDEFEDDEDPIDDEEEDDEDDYEDDETPQDVDDGVVIEDDDEEEDEDEDEDEAEEVDDLEEDDPDRLEVLQNGQ